MTNTMRRARDFCAIRLAGFFVLLTLGLAACAPGGDMAAESPQPPAPSSGVVAEAGWPELADVETAPGFSDAGLGALEARMRRFVDDGDVAGVATLLVKDAAVASYVAYGERSAETGAPIEADTIYRIYSMTKPITGVALMTLYEDGAFSLDDPVSMFIPEFEDLQVLAGESADGSAALVPLKRQPTMRELLSHTAGFAYGLGGSDFANAAFRERRILESPDLDAFIDQVAGVPLLHQPGEIWAYSAAVDIQGAIVERLSGMSFGAYLQETIFDPLGMEDTGFFVPGTDYNRLSDVYGYDPETGEFGPYRGADVAFREDTVAMEAGGHGLVSTLGDYARFCWMLAEGGALDGARILEPETVALMRTNVLTDAMRVGVTGNLETAETAGRGFGLGFGVIFDAQASSTPYGQGTYFWGGLAGTWFWIDPENDLFFIGMIQRFGQGGPNVDMIGASAALVYDALVE